MGFLVTDLANISDFEQELVAADTTVKKIILQPQLTPIALGQAVFSNNDVGDHHVQMILSRGGVDAVIGAVTVAAGQGYGGNTPAAIFSYPFTQYPANPSFGPGAELSWRVEEALTLTNKVTLQLTIGSY